MLDVECSLRGNADSYLAKVKAQHRHNPRLSEPTGPRSFDPLGPRSFDPKALDTRCFTIQHFAGKVVYDTTDFLGERES